MSNGLGNWVGKEVKMGQALQIRETCVSCMCQAGVMCVSKENHMSQMARIGPLANKSVEM